MVTRQITHQNIFRVMTIGFALVILLLLAAAAVGIRNIQSNPTVITRKMFRWVIWRVTIALSVSRGLAPGDTPVIGYFRRLINVNLRRPDFGAFYSLRRLSIAKAFGRNMRM